MKYSKYLSTVIKQFGGINLNQEASQTLFNVVHLEAELKIYEHLNKEKQHVVKIHEIKEQLHFLTGGQDPKTLMKQLHQNNYSKPFTNNNSENDKAWDEYDIYQTNPKKRY